MKQFWQSDRSPAWTAPALGAGGALLVLGFSHASLAGAAAALGLAAAGWLLRTRPAGDRGAAGRLERHLDGERGLGQRLAPVWSGHIASAMGQTEEAIASLAGRFAGIVQRLQQTASVSAAATASVSNGERGLVAVFADSERELRAVVDSLQAAMRSKAAMLDQIQGLAAYTRELQDMATAVASIAAQTNLLALNAAIEAARAGESGRGFAVVAREVRALSAMSADTGKQIQEKIGTINSAILSARAAAEASATQEEHQVAQSRHAIDSVLGGFRGVTDALVDTCSRLQDDSTGIQAEVAGALVQLQFQDRVTQIMSHVRTSIDRLGAALAQDDPAPLDCDALLAELERTYAMADEHAVHRPAGRALAAPAEEITFF